MKLSEVIRQAYLADDLPVPVEAGVLLLSVLKLESDLELHKRALEYVVREYVADTCTDEDNCRQSFANIGKAIISEALAEASKL